MEQQQQQQKTTQAITQSQHVLVLCWPKMMCRAKKKSIPGDIIFSTGRVVFPFPVSRLPGHAMLTSTGPLLPFLLLPSPPVCCCCWWWFGCILFLTNFEFFFTNLVKFDTLCCWSVVVALPSLPPPPHHSSFVRRRRYSTALVHLPRLETRHSFQEVPKAGEWKTEKRNRFVRSLEYCSSSAGLDSLHRRTQGDPNGQIIAEMMVIVWLVGWWLQDHD